MARKAKPNTLNEAGEMRQSTDKTHDVNDRSPPIKKVNSRKRAPPLNQASAPNGTTKRRKIEPLCMPLGEVDSPQIRHPDSRKNQSHTRNDRKFSGQGSVKAALNSDDERRQDKAITETGKTLPSVSTGVDPSRLPSEIHHLMADYSFTSRSILSSTKMQQKIPIILEHISHFSFSDPSAKPGVVILSAKATVAGKMISIVEIVKKEIEKSKGKWWQYSKLEGHTEEMKATKRGAGRTLTEADEADTVPSGTDMDRAATADNLSEEREAGEVVDLDGEDDVEAAFETMSLPQKKEAPENPKRIRNVPIMTVYIARVPVPGLKGIYGEQTNART